jgi:HEAT repeat protein
VIAASRTRRLVFARAAEFLCAYVLAIWIVYAHFLSRSSGSSFLLLAAAFAVVQTGAIAFLIAVIVGRALVAEVGARRTRRLQPAIVEALAQHAAGADRSSELEALHRLHPFHVEQCFIELLPTVAGTGRESLSRAARGLGIVARWERQCRSRRVGLRRSALTALGYVSGIDMLPLLVSALDDPDPEIRLDAACAVLRNQSDQLVIERVFEVAVRSGILERAILAEELRTHAAVLCEKMIPACLDSRDRRRILTALELLHIWGRALPVPQVFALVCHDDGTIRAAALRVLPLVAGAPDVVPEILTRLTDEEPNVRAAAAFVGGRLLSETADRALAACLRDSRPEVARAAGFALAELGPAGVETLEREAVSADRGIATVALEALERVRIGRCDYARS